ncbi:L-type lectin-domain containing receptor kinase S.5 [Tripterygium wilfordii]|uniref:L-type lectin-domain containing receptor kinase S.5 n=1 Tax=Tripterygium wilfordii TaxID=458696 RepID=A0A7J7DX29_TRIWF|nr:L-type lectin-domain containing receptor kinase S.5 [Tripterygium wilfordii]
MSMHFSLLFMILVLAFLMGCALSQAQGLNTSYQPSFQDDDKADFILNNSYIVLNAIQVTPDVSNGALIVNMSGRALYGKQFKLWSENKGITRASFNSTFVINISPQTVPGGEGLAFIIAADHNLPQNSEGQWLGIVNAETNGSGTANIVAVEFDTRKSYTEDLDDNHVGLDVNSINSIKQVSLTNFGLNLSAGNDTLVNVIYDGKNMTVFVSLRDKDGVVSRRNQAFSESIDLSAYLPQNVFVGFSASTSSVTQLNCVKSWVFQGSDIGDGSNKLLWVYITAPLVTILLMSIAFLLLWKLIYRKKQLVDSYDNVEEEIKGSSMAPLKFRDYSSGIANWLWELYGYGRILDGVDPKLEEEYQVEEVECMLLLGLGCCHPNPHHRPSMKTVLQVLTGEAAPPNVPTKRPNFVWPAMPPSFNASDCSLAGGQLAPFSDMDGR